MARPNRIVAGPGRPTRRYEAEGALEILRRLEAGEMLHHICKDEHLPDDVTVYGWVEDGQHPQFAEAFHKARRTQAHRWAGQVVEIADQIPEDPSAPQVFRAQTQIRARQWSASRVLPEQYGEPRIAPAAGASASVHVYLPSKGSPGDDAKLIDHQEQPQLPGLGEEDDTERR